MKVFLWTGGHTIAESLLLDPPEGVRMETNVNLHEDRGKGGTGERTFSVNPNLKRILDEAIYSFGIPRFLPTFTDADLIHTISGLVPTAAKPWVTSISMPSSFFGLHDDWCASKIHVSILRRILRSRNCKKVLCFSEATMEGLKFNMRGRIESNLEGKIDLLHPAVNPSRFVQKVASEDGAFRILFVGNLFYDKGGRELFKAVDRLSSKFDVHLDIVANAPPHHKRDFEEFVRAHQEAWVTWHVPGIKRATLIQNLYPNADVFVMCSYVDIFGFVILEAMASGVPVIAANVYAQREIVVDGKNGFLIEVPASAFAGSPALRTPRSVSVYRSLVMNERIFEPVVDQIEAKLKLLIEDSRIRRAISASALDTVTNGRFGITARNERLKSIYEEALES